MALDIIKLYGLLDYPESKTLRCLSVFSIYYPGIYPLYRDTGEQGIKKIIRQMYSPFPGASSDEMAKVEEIRDAVVKMSDWRGQHGFDSPLWIVFSDEKIHELAENEEYVELHSLRRAINSYRQNLTIDNITYEDMYEDIYNGGDIPEFSLVHNRYRSNFPVLPFFDTDRASDMYSIFVTPESMDNAKASLNTLGINNYVYIFCLLQISKIQDILHLAREREELPEVDELNQNDLNMWWYPSWTMHDLFLEPEHYKDKRYWDDDFMRHWYNFVVANAEESKDPGEVYFRHAVVILDSPYQTIPVDLGRLRDPEYTKEWIFECIMDFAERTESTPPKILPLNQLRDYVEKNEDLEEI